MIGIDTNILVRYIAQDDLAQSRLATRLIETECSAATPGYISLVVLVELVWVSESCYDAGRSDIAQIVQRPQHSTTCRPGCRGGMEGASTIQRFKGGFRG